MGKYIDRAERRVQYTCAQICVEVDLDVWILEAIKLRVVDWTHVQELDYKQLSFKCRHCHGYMHFSRSCKKKVEEEASKKKGEQRTQVQKTSLAKPGNNSKGNKVEIGSGSKPLGSKQQEVGAVLQGHFNSKQF